jgi:hypothetical protein
LEKIKLRRKQLQWENLIANALKKSENLESVMENETNSATACIYSGVNLTKWKKIY